MIDPDLIQKALRSRADRHSDIIHDLSGGHAGLSCLRPVSAVAMEASEEWLTGRACLTMKRE